ncbi:HAD family hydrolase [Lysobacter brunescens]|uniref:HAD family hydrolase n=1 Tax=Lysobacter brunescens TaxID=262323 RepID=A0ABW2YCT7_9GAMM
MGIDLVLFDLDDVLVDYSHEVRCRTLGERIGRDADAVRAALFESGLERQADLGRIDPEGVARVLSETLATPVTLGDCVAARAAAMTPRLALGDLIAALAARCRLAVLTNNGLMVRDHFATLCPPFAAHFAGAVHCSAMYGMTKPDPAVFAHCAEALGVAPSRVLFIDDKAANAGGAIRAGMSGHHYQGIAGLRSALAAHHLLENPSHGV